MVEEDVSELLLVLMDISSGMEKRDPFLEARRDLMVVDLAEMLQTRVEDVSMLLQKSFVVSILTLPKLSLGCRLV